MIYQNLTFDQERALYGLHGAQVAGCRFDGPADGESPLKECERLTLTDCLFALRYPLWHVTEARIACCRMTESCRAALWYCSGLRLENCELGGIKALRECSDSTLTNCRITSPEFGWQCAGLTMTDCRLTGEYAFLHSSSLTFTGLRLQGKYSFQYVHGARLSRCELDTKDAFWHSKDVTVTDSVITGEYLGWYSENLHLIRCKLVGTQPLCYAKGLVLEDCEMLNADLAFENSQVNATVRGGILSVKNPISGSIRADSIGEIILDEHQKSGADCRITAGSDS